MSSVTEIDIYTDIRTYLIALFNCTVIRGRQNNLPLPEDCIVMTILFNTDLDQIKTDYTDNGTGVTAQAQQSIQATMQLDFFGVNAANRSMQVQALWRSPYTTERLSKCQPLFSKPPQNLQYINESGVYEQRYMLEVALQYNPYYEYNEESATSMDLPTIGVII